MILYTILIVLGLLWFGGSCITLYEGLTVQESLCDEEDRTVIDYLSILLFSFVGLWFLLLYLGFILIIMWIVDIMSWVYGLVRKGKQL